MSHLNPGHEGMHLRVRQAAASSNGSDNSAASSVSSQQSDPSTSTPDSTPASTPATTPTTTPTTSATPTPTTSAAPTSATPTSATPTTTTPATTASSNENTSTASASAAPSSSQAANSSTPASSSIKDDTTSASGDTAQITSSAAAVATSVHTATSDAAALSSLVLSTTTISGTPYTLRHGTIYADPTGSVTSLTFGSISYTTPTSTSQGNSSSPGLNSAGSTGSAGKPLSEKASAGIAIAVLFVVLGIVSGVVFLVKRKNHRKSMSLNSWMQALEEQQKPQADEITAGLKQSASVKSYKQLSEEEKLELQPYRAPYQPMNEKPPNSLRISRNEDMLTEMRAGPYGDTQPTLPIPFPYNESPKEDSQEESYSRPDQQLDHEFKAIPSSENITALPEAKQAPHVVSYEISEDHPDRGVSPVSAPPPERALSPVSEQGSPSEIRDGPYRRPVHRAERIKKLAVRFSVQHDHAR